MIIILGLIILVAAVVVGVTGVLGNGGSAHAVSHFSVLGYHLTGSAGTLFLTGIVVGAAGLLGLSLMLAGARRRRRRGSAATRRLRQSRRETAAASQERDDLIEQRDTARADAASQLASTNGTAPHGPPLSDGNDRPGRLHALRRRLTPAPTAAQSDPPGARPDPEAPARAPGPGTSATSPASDMTADTSDPNVAAISPALEAHATAPASEE